MTDLRQLDVLLDRVLDGLYTEEEARQLNDVLRTDMDACRRYVQYVKLHGRLTWGDGLKAGAEGSPHQREANSAGADPAACGFAPDAEFPPAAEAAGPPPPAVPFLLSPLTTSRYPPATNFVGGPVFSYMVATLILAVMLLSAWAYNISRDVPPLIVENRKGASTSEDNIHTPELVFVGHITGMKDCQWADPATETYLGSSVPLGRKYALSAGLMKISYNSGANVILEGPCTYKVESEAGGYLALGRLTARVEKRDEVRGQNPRPKTQDPRPQSEISKSPNSQSALPRPSSPTWEPSSASKSAIRATPILMSFAGRSKSRESAAPSPLLPGEGSGVRAQLCSRLASPPGWQATEKSIASTSTARRALYRPGLSGRSPGQ